MFSRSHPQIRRWFTFGVLATFILLAVALGVRLLLPGQSVGQLPPVGSPILAEGAESQPLINGWFQMTGSSEAAEADQPDQAIKFRLARMRDEHGNIPPDGLSKAVAQSQRMQAAQASLPNVGGIAPNQWTWIGPGNVGGRVRSIVVNPNAPSQMLVGSVGGGVWRTTDDGAAWQPVNDFMANLAISTMVMDPTNPNTIYAGTGEGFYNADAIPGAGVFKSLDGGLSWSQLASTNNYNFNWVDRLAISPNGSTILAATLSGFWRSTDGGAHWTQVNTGDSYAYLVKDIAFSPTDNSKAIASGSYGLAWYSTDGGATWTPASGLPALDWLGRVEVAYAPSNPAIVYAGVAQNSGEIWKSADGGHSYSLVNTGNSYMAGQGWYDNAVWVDPTNASILVVGGQDLWRSLNGGTTLTKISQWWSAPYSAHADHHVIVSAPGFNGTTNKTVYFGNDGGVYRADDVYNVALTSGWQELNNNLGITQFYGAAGNASTGVIVGGTQDNGTLHFSGGTENWTAMYGGDGGYSAADPTDPNYFYGEYVDLLIHRSTNGGLSSSYITTGLSDAGSCANFIAPFILDPNNANTLLAGGCSLWRSTNVKATTPTWSAIKSAGAGTVSAIAAAPGNSDIIWVGYGNGEIDKTANGTAAAPTWQRQDLHTPNLPQRYVTRLTVDPTNANVVYATYGGYSPGNVWQTSDGGQTWNDITGSGLTQLPQAPVYSLVVSPFNAAWLYVGTEIGVFASTDGGASWGLPQDGPANVSVDELFWMNTTLVAATHGRGLFAVETSGSSTVANDDLGAATPISSSPYSRSEDTTNATTAGDDPAFACGSQSQGSASVWFRYTPGANGVLAANTIGSGYDTLLAVWRGSRGSLSSLACDDDSGGNATSALTTTLSAGTTYYLEVARYTPGLLPPKPNAAISLPSGGGGSMILSVTFIPAPPSNDDVNAATQISSTPYSRSEDTTNATTAGDDPTFACGSQSQGSASVWFRYTPSANGVLAANTTGSGYDTMLAVWRGSRGSLSSLACNDDWGGNVSSALTATLTGGVTYTIEVAHYAPGLLPPKPNAAISLPAGGGGSMTLAVSFTPAGPPNDDLGAATQITSAPYSRSEDSTNATTAGDDPAFACGNQSQGSASVWFRYTPSANGKLAANTVGSGYDTMLAVWRGSRGSLVNIGCDDDSGGNAASALTVTLAAGTTYTLEVVRYTPGLLPPKPNAAIDLPAGGGGSMLLHVTFTPTPIVIPRRIYLPLTRR